MLVKALEHSEKGTSSNKGSEGTHQAPCPVPIRAVPTQKRFGVGGAPLLTKLTPQGKPQCGARNGYRLQPSPVAWRLGWEGISHQHDLQSALTLPSTSPEGCCRLAPSLCLPPARGWQPARPTAGPVLLGETGRQLGCLLVELGDARPLCAAGGQWEHWERLGER